MPQKTPQNKNKKTSKCMAFICVLFFFLSLKLTYIISIPNCLAIIYTYVLHSNLHQSPVKSGMCVCDRVFLPLMFPVSPY